MDSTTTERFAFRPDLSAADRFADGLAAEGLTIEECLERCERVDIVLREGEHWMHYITTAYKRKVGWRR